MERDSVAMLFPLYPPYWRAGIAHPIKQYHEFTIRSHASCECMLPAIRTRSNASIKLSSPVYELIVEADSDHKLDASVSSKLSMAHVSVRTKHQS
ncbi:unnamed protein product [Somion occarium]|uniref:Uncharacterized protein n=1 Tax=Somion occarium TaxID=3059160 RepID=A0ABP1DJX0_9APHY